MGTIADKLGYVLGTKAALKAAIQNKGIAVPDSTTFRQYAGLIGSISGGVNDVSEVVNQPWYNPGTGLGGIAWIDPTGEFDHLEIIDTKDGGSEVVAEVAPGVEFWEPEEGTHQYLIRAVFASGGTSVGVQLTQTTYAIVYTANLQSITIPMAAANQVVLTFDNFVSLTDASGFSVSGIDDTLEFVDQPDVKTIRLRLVAHYFSQGGSYSLSYAPENGNVETNDGEPIAPITGYGIDNYADYAPSVFVSAEVPQAEPQTLVLLMSRPINVTSAEAFTLSGTTASITGMVTEGATVEFSLNEPVDHSDVESDIKISFSGVGATDDAGQAVAAFSNCAVTNNSTNQAISIQSAEIPASDSHSLIVVMQGAVAMTSAAGFAIASSDQEDLPDLADSDYEVSDGTITFSFDTSLQNGKTFTVSYDGTGTLKAANNNDTIRAFSQAVTNHSTDAGGIGAGSSARNLATVVLGREASTPADVTAILTAVHETVVSGHATNLVGGDFVNLPVSPSYPLTVAAGYDAGGAISLTANADLGANGKHISFMIVTRNGLKGKNGNNYDHVVFHSKNVLGYTTETDVGGHYMEASNINTNGYYGCKMRQYLLNNVLPALKALGIPFDEDWMKAPARQVSKGGSAANPGADTIQDKIFLPTEYEMFGAYTYSNSQAEAAANQGRFEYYDDNTKRVKYNKDNAARYYWEDSPYSGSTGSFCRVNYSGAAGLTGSYCAYGLAPAFCVG